MSPSERLPKRVLITAGGTGGHLYPAQALAQQLTHLGAEVFFAAGGLEGNRHFDRRTFPFEEIACGPLLSRHPLKVLRGAVNLWRGFRQSLALVKRDRPHAVVGFGSYYTVPVLLAAAWLKIPIILHEANAIPGRANRWLSSLATRVGVHFPSAAPFFGGKAIEVGLPLRVGYQLGEVAKKEALAHYGFSLERPTLLICGGSQGAQSINLLASGILPLLQRLSLQVIHVTGNERMADQLRGRYAAFSIPAQVKAFEAEMQRAWGAADAFIGRSGASTIAEALEFEVPGFLIPYPYAADRHQERNADFLVDTVQAARKCLEQGLTALQLGEAFALFFQEEQLAAYRASMRRYKEKYRGMTLCQLVLDTVFGGDR